MDAEAAKLVGAGLAAIGVGMAALGVGNVFGSFLESALRNPGAADGQQGRLFIGFAAAELLGLLAFVVSGLNSETIWLAPVIAIPSFALMLAITLLELLVSAIQAYVFALLTSLYINDAVNLH